MARFHGLVEVTTATHVLSGTLFPQNQHVFLTFSKTRGQSQPLRNTESHQGTDPASHEIQEPRILDKAERPTPVLLAELRFLVRGGLPC